MPVNAVIVLSKMQLAVNAADAGCYAAFYADDAEINIVGGANLQSRVEIEAYERDLLTNFPGTQFFILDVWDFGNVVAARYGVHSPGKVPSGHEGLLFCRFSTAGKISSEVRYLDSYTPMVQLGLAPGRKLPVPPPPTSMKACRAQHDSTERDHIGIVIRHIDALNRSDDKAWANTVGYGPTFSEMTALWPAGPQTPADWQRAWRKIFRQPRIEIVSLFAAADVVVAQTILRTSGIEVSAFRGSGRRRSLHRAVIYRLNNGRIVSMVAFMNGAQVVNAFPK